MARIEEPSAEHEAEWKSWVADRPSAVRAVAERFDPWSLYRMKGTDQRVTVYSFSEGPTVTLTVNVLADFNLLVFERQVFGIDPDDLEPCEIPAQNEPVGAVLSQEQVAENNIDAMRVAIRPDLWRMGDDGIAVRR